MPWAMEEDPDATRDPAPSVEPVMPWAHQQEEPVMPAMAEEPPAAMPPPVAEAYEGKVVPSLSEEEAKARWLARSMDPWPWRPSVG